MADNIEIACVEFEKGYAAWVFKYGTVAGFFICFSVLMIVDMYYDHKLLLLNLIILIYLGLFLFILQICYSWFYPLKLIIFNDKLCSFGAWKVRHIIKFSDIKFIQCKEFGLLIQRKVFFFNKIWITSLQDPDRKAEKLLIEIFKKKEIDIAIIQ